MTNNQFIRDYVRMNLDGKNGRLTAKDDKLFSYNTCIGERRGNKILVNITRYSMTTSTHRNQLIREAESWGMEIKKVDGIRMGAQHLDFNTAFAK